MSRNSILLYHLTFTGATKKPANLGFSQGLNVLYGASDTGKSFVLETIDFMFGSSTPLRDIPERVGYDRVFLGIQIGDEFLTLVRSTSGGAFQKFDGLHKQIPSNQPPVILAAKHSSKSDDNLSAFILKKIGFENKLVKTNAAGKLRPISFRDLIHLCVIDETKIQSKTSPIETGQFINKTVEYSVFKFLLTGVDDSSFVPEVKKGKKQNNQNPKIELLDELLLSYKNQLPNNQTESDIEEQLAKIDTSIKDFQIALEAFETTYDGLIQTQKIIARKIDDSSSRRNEIDEINARFELLNRHYSTDLERLEGIREAGSLLGALEPRLCPLCGASPDHQHPEDSSTNLEMIVAACLSEEKKIKKLQSELVTTIQQLKNEASSFDKNIPVLQLDKKSNETKISELWEKLSTQRGAYSSFVEKRSEVRQFLTLTNQINELNALKVAIENESKSIKRDNAEPERLVDFSTSVQTEFEVLVEGILKAWNFPDSDRIKFDEATRDLVISGKHRASRGKGMRSITHAAFIIGILEFCKEKLLNHPGMLVLDSPLLAYREPEEDEVLEADDAQIVQSNVQDKFYEYLSKWNDRQIIIIENVTPPAAIIKLPSSQMFTKNLNKARYGFFPNI